MAPILTGTPIVYLSPLDFLAKPILWLQILHDWSHHQDYSYVTTGGPPFALDLIVKKLSHGGDSSAASLDSLDLSGVISIILGAEPIRASSLLAFEEATRKFGFSPNSYMPAYGLVRIKERHAKSELTLIASIGANSFISPLVLFLNFMSNRLRMCYT